MSNLELKQIATDLEVSGPYKTMLETINNKLPATIFDSENFNKSSSQFKGATLDVADLTPINAARHLLATINKTRQALEEAQIGLRKETVKHGRLTEELESCTDRWRREELQIELDQIETQMANGEASVRGAIRKLHFNLNQYQAILEHLGVDHITEEMYEADQARFHVMTAFNQALTAARARNGYIDEGNHIYLFQLGINGAVAQMEVDWLLNTEAQLLNDGKAPTHKMVTNWLEACADKYAGNAQEYAQRRGVLAFDESSLLALERGE